MGGPGTVADELGGRPDPFDRLEATFAAMRDGVIVQGADGTIVMANPAAAVLFGVDRGGLIGRCPANLTLWSGEGDGRRLHPEEHPAMRTLRTRQSQVGVIAGVADPAGSGRRWLQISTALIHPAGDDAPIVVSTLTDITAIRSAEEQLRAVVAATGDGLAVVDRNLRVTFANPAAAAILGMPSAAVIEADVGGLGIQVVDERGDPMAEDRWPVVTTLSSGRAEHGVVLGINRRGEDRRIWLMASFEPIGTDGGDGGPHSVVVTFADVTRFREAEAELRSSERRYRSLFGYQADAVLRVSPSGTLISVSPSVWRVLRFDPNDPPELGTRIHADDAHQARRALRRMVDGEVGVRFTVRIRRGDGRWIWAEIAGSPVYDDAGALREVQQSIREVSDREHQERDSAALQRVVSLIARGAAADEALSVLAMEACAALPADSVTLVRYVSGRGEPLVRHPPVEGIEPAHPNAHAHEILTRGIAAGVREMRPMAGPRQRSSGTAPKGMTVAVPVVTGRTMWGSLWAGLTAGDFAEGAVERLTTYGDLAALAVMAGERLAGD